MEQKPSTLACGCGVCCYPACTGFMQRLNQSNKDRNIVLIRLQWCRLIKYTYFPVSVIHTKEAEDRKVKKKQVGYKPNHRVCLWDIALCSLGADRRFRGAYCLYHQSDDGIRHLWNVGIFQRDYTKLYPRRLSSSEFFTAYQSSWDSICNKPCSIARPYPIIIHYSFLGRILSSMRNDNLVYPSPWDFKSSFTCRKILRHGTFPLYFPSEGKCAADFYRP
jgi:hypothetical protein